MAQVDVIVEQAAIKDGFDYWTIDLDENDLVYAPNELKRKFLGKEAMYSGFKFKIEGVEFYTYVKDKIVLMTRKVQ